MTQYVVLSWQDLGAAAAARIAKLRRDLVGDGQWRLAVERPGMLVFVSRERSLSVEGLAGRGVVIGDVFSVGGSNYANPGGLACQGLSEEAICRLLATTCWGRYVAVLRHPDAQGLTAFRDPMGALECLTWSTRGVDIVASCLPDWLLSQFAPPLTLDWSRIGAYLEGPIHLSGPLALNGLRALTPGALRRCSAIDDEEVVVWSPISAAGRCVRNPEPAALAGVVDDCVAALARGRAILAEVSGGLDSAIVASTLARTPSVRVVQWLNYHLDDPEGDERIYARAVADRAGFRLSEASKPPVVLDERWLASVAEGPRPGLNGLDYAYDRDIQRRCSELGAEALFTGRGGDTVFFQMATPLIAADYVCERGVSGLVDNVVPNLARWTKRSAWSVLLQSARGLRPRLFASGPAKTEAAARHPWLGNVEYLPPAKQIQVRSLASSLSFMGECGRSRTAHQIHPLLSQPVVEHCLGISAPDLTYGSRDRAFARKTFADRLPQAVIHRRGKGDATAFFGRAVADNLEFLRPLLLEGRLVAQGLVERPNLEAMLDRDHLLWRGGFGLILHMAIIEAWVQGWERRAGDLSAGRAHV